jgi:hypothetical protein
MPGRTGQDMTGSLLRTGTARDYHPLGAVGNPVYLSAPQLRAAIARRLGQGVADILAIPQRNEDGDTIDWYAPVPGPVVPWSAATPDERSRGKAALTDARGAIEKLAAAMQAEIRSDHQVFGRLLEQVTAFPNDEHLYLVNDHPVMTFWGFQGLEVPSGGETLLDLPAPPPTPVAMPPKARRWWWWLLPLLLLLALIAGYLLLREPEPVETPIVPTPTQVPPPAADAAATMADEPAPVEEPAIPEPEPVTPLQERRDLRIRDTETRVHDNEHWVVGPDGKIIDRDVTTTSGAAVPSSSPETLPIDATAGFTDSTSTPASVSDETPPGSDASEEATGITASELDQQSGETDLQKPTEAASDTEASATAADIPPDEAEQGVKSKLEAEPSPLDLDEHTEMPSPQEPADTALDTETTKPETEGQPPDLTQPPETQAPEAPPDTVQVPEQAAAKTEEKADQPAPELTQEPESPPPGQIKGPESKDKEGKIEQPAPDLTQKPVAADARSVPKPPPGSAEVQRSGASDPSKAAEPLRIPAEAMATGSTRFLNGGWRTATSLQDPSTSLPVEMSYRLKNGAGQVQLRRYDGSLCTAGAQAAMRSGKLIIDSAGDIRCPDGANFGRPRMECVPGRDGRADCAGHYATGESFSVDLNRARGNALGKGAGD